MKNQILVIHGGDTFETYGEYLTFLNDFTIHDLSYFRGKGWKNTLEENLGEEYEVILPQMPNKFNAKYSEWKIWFEKFIPLLNEKVILVGHSLGGIFLAKYLSENNFPKEITSTILVSACFGDNMPEYSVGDFKLGESLSKFEEQGGIIYLFHSEDDEVVPVSDVERFKEKLPSARAMLFKDRGHFTSESFPEIADLISKTSQR